MLSTKIKMVTDEQFDRHNINIMLNIAYTNNYMTLKVPAKNKYVLCFTSCVEMLLLLRGRRGGGRIIVFGKLQDMLLIW